MISYKSQRCNNGRYIFRQWLLSTLIVAIPLLIDLLFPGFNLVNSSFWFTFLPVFSLSRLIYLAEKDRVNELFVDTDNKQITFKYYDVNRGQMQKSFPFESLSLKIYSRKPVWLSEPIEIYFFRGRRHILSISKLDGFSIADLLDLKTRLEALTSPTEK